MEYWSIVRPVSWGPSVSQHNDGSYVYPDRETAETALTEVTVKQAPGRFDVLVQGIVVGTFDSRDEAEAEARRFRRDISEEEKRG